MSKLRGQAGRSHVKNSSGRRNHAGIPTCLLLLNQLLKLRKKRLKLLEAPLSHLRTKCVNDDGGNTASCAAGQRDAWCKRG